MNKIKKFIKCLQKPVLIFVLIILLLSSFVSDYKQAEAATYTWTQASWAGGTSATSATHDTNRDGQTPWTYYSSASTTISASTSITLSTTASSTTQTTTADFNLGTNSQTTVASNSVTLALNPQAYTITQTDDTSNVANTTQQGGWAYGTFSTTQQNGTTGNGASVVLTPTITNVPFSYTGAQQTWVVPAGVSSITVDVRGAQGGTTPGYSTGGNGARVQTTLSVTPGQTLYIYVGGQGILITGGWNGGGTGSGSQYFAGGGGGGSDIRSGDIALTNRVIVAGGGGGAGLSGDGGTGGYPNGGTGGGWNPGYGGTQSAGGSGGSCYAATVCPTAGGLGYGGNGGYIGDGTSGCGGGGGGLYGGGGGGYNSSLGGGGGGSSWTSGTSPTWTNGYQTGNGYVNISYPAYNSSGTYTAYVDAGLAVSYTWNTFSWSETIPSGADITVKVKTTADAVAPSFASGTCDGSGSPITLTDTCRNTSHRYLWYQATLTPTADQTQTPTLDQVQVSVTRNAYYSSGTFTSGVINIGYGVPSWGNLSWTKTGTGTITMKARSCAASDCAGATDWASCSNITSGNALSIGGCATNGHQYVQYQASLSTADTTVTPSLDDVTIGYNIYDTTQVLTSSKYNTSSDANIMGGIKWDEDASLPTGTTVTASLRTASSEANLDSASWTNFTNATSNCSKPSGTVTCNSSAIPAGMKDGTGDQWVQYKLTLTSTGANTPTADNVVLTYVVNARPEFDIANTTASQISDSSNANWGKEQINYSIKDTDTLSGTTNPGYVTPSFEYNIGGGWVSITSGYLSAGALDNKTVSESAYTTYTAYWDAKSQIPSQYTSTGQIRITLNDNEGANNSTTTTISNITIDTTAPTLSTFTLDSSADTLTLAGSDNSNIQYRISNNSDGSGTWQTVGAVSTTTTIAWTYAPDSTGYESVTIAYRDIYGNTSTTTDVAPYMPNNFYYKDICNTAINDWREFLSWGQYTATTSAAFGSYKVYRSTDGTTYSLLVTNTPYTLNYHVDTTVASTTTYYYKTVTVDSDGDISSYTTPISDLPNGQGGSDSTAPIITSGPTVAETRSTWARITWTTDEISNSIVEYGATQSYGSTKTVDTMNTSHSVTVTGLTPNTTYYYRVKSADIATNTITSSGSSFTTTQGTIISDVTTESITDTTATIVWNTNTDSNSWVYYSTNSSFTSSSTSGTNTLVGTSTNNYFQHRVTLTGLTERTTYYYYVKSTDANSDLATDTNAGSYYSFTTTYDNQPPVISGILTPVRASNAIVIVWNTDENADTQVYYDTSTHAACSGYANSSTLDTNKTINHAVSLTSLTASTKYYYRVKSADANGNSTCSDEQTASTVAENEIITVYVGGGGAMAPTVTDTTPPSISNIKVSDIGAFTATVSFETSEAALGLINYGKDTSYGNTAGSDNYQSSHQIKLSGLKLGTEYHFRVKAADKNGNIGESEDQTFTTLFAAEVLEDLVTLENAEQFQEQLEGLLESVMPSLVPPFVSNVKIDEINEDSALVFWKTNIPAHGSLFFVEDSKYEEGKYATEIAENKGKVKDHELKITDLMPSAKYHVQAKSYVFPDVVGKSKDYTFFTKSAKTKPEIINVGNTEFTVAWRTNKETSSFVQYTNTATGQKGQTGTEDKTSQHVVRVENLIPDTLYEVRVYGYDADNNLVEADPLTVRTKKDVVPPKISSISINSAFVPYKADQLQTVISWKTSEPANSLVYFEEGVGVSTDLKNKAGQLDEYVLDHSVIITNFKPATIYRIKISSADEARNITVGPMRTILAPRASESVLEIITKNLEEAFGFLKNLNR